MRSQGLRTVGYYTNELNKAKEWYSEVFETAPYFDEPYFDEPFYVGFNIGGYELGLMPAEDGIAKGDNVLVYWAVDDAASAYNELLNKGATAHQAPQDVGDGIMVATVKDPWGNILGLIYNPHFK
ncbi:MAG: bleomycin resistance protein [Bacteroidetes bacterium 46-16]|nr:MAG: bleomycin resistance protein [Bacteroidetes bacterium 46-16]